MTNERFLVTGCAGFIGSHLVERLVRDGVDTVGVDNFSTGKHENVAAFKDTIRFVEGDLTDPAVAEQACAGVTHILHQASIPSVPRSIKNPLASMHSSVTATVTLLEAARKAGVKRLVQAGSSSAYGDTERLPKVENMLPRPLSPYAAAKLSQELYAHAYARSFGLDTVTLRYFNVFGPRQDPQSEYAAVIPKFITLMLKGTAPTIYGDGEQSRDFTYIDNVVEGNLRAARAATPLGGMTINLANGDRVSLLELVDSINSILGTNLTARHEAGRAGDVKHSQADNTRATENIDYAPVVTFGEGLRRTVDFFRSQTA